MSALMSRAIDERNAAKHTLTFLSKLVHRKELGALLRCSGSSENNTVCLEEWALRKGNGA